MTRPAIYNRPAKPLFTTVTRRRDPAPLATLDLAAPIAVDKATECHVTPSDVAARMVRALGPCGDIMTLEPSAGTGQLVRALLEAGQSKFEICQVERHHALLLAVLRDTSSLVPQSVQFVRLICGDDCNVMLLIDIN